MTPPIPTRRLLVPSAALSIGDLRPLLWLRAHRGAFQDVAKTTGADLDDVVGAWQDSAHVKDSIAAADVEQATTAKKPLRKAQGLLFDGSDDYLAQKVYEDETGASWGIANHGLSLVDGNAFLRVEGVDLSPFAGVEGTDTPYMVVLTDQAGKVGWGYAGNQEAAEALGAELVPNPGFETAGGGDPDFWANWVETATGDGDHEDEGVLVHGGSHAAKLITGSANGNLAYIGQTIAVTPGKLYKLTHWTRGDGTHGLQRLVYDLTNSVAIHNYTAADEVTDTTYTQKTIYVTVPAACISLYFAFRTHPIIAAAGYVDDVSIKEVLHAGTDAVHLVSTRHGSTRNWAGIEAGFDYNDSAYTLQVRKVWAQLLSAFTIGAWINATDATNFIIIDKLAGNYGYMLNVDAADKVNCTVGDGTDVQSATDGAVMSQGVYHLVIATYDGTNIRSYLDAVLKATQAQSVPGDTSEPFRLAFEGTNYADGSMNEAFLLDYALDAKRIRRLYEDNKESYN